MQDHKCVMCGGDTAPCSVDKNLRVKHDNFVHELLVKELPVESCAKCNSEFASPSYDSVVRVALREFLSLMSPEDLVKSRSTYGLSQTMLSEQTGIAVKTISQIENNRCVQSKSTDDHLRRTFELLRQTKSIESICENVSVRSNNYQEQQLVSEPVLDCCVYFEEDPQFALAA